MSQGSHVLNSYWGNLNLVNSITSQQTMEFCGIDGRQAVIAAVQGQPPEQGSSQLGTHPLQKFRPFSRSTVDSSSACLDTFFERLQTVLDRLAPWPQNPNHDLRQLTQDSEQLDQGLKSLPLLAGGRLSEDSLES